MKIYSLIIKISDKSALYFIESVNLKNRDCYFASYMVSYIQTEVTNSAKALEIIQKIIFGAFIILSVVTPERTAGGMDAVLTEIVT